MYFTGSSPFSPPTVRRINFGWIQGQHKLNSTFLSQQSSCAEHETPPPHVPEPFFSQSLKYITTQVGGPSVPSCSLISILISRNTFGNHQGKKKSIPPTPNLNADQNEMSRKICISELCSQIEFEAQNKDT